MSTESILREEEGKELRLYKDTEGILTIGIGYNIQARGLPDDIVEELFRRDVAQLRKDAAQLHEYAPLDPVRQGVLERMVYQIGLAGVKAFKHTLLAISEQRWRDASDHILNSKWARQTPARARREAQRMLSGVE